MEKQFFIEAFLNQGALIQIDEKNALVGWGHWHERAQIAPAECGFYVDDFFLSEKFPWKVPEFFEKISFDTLRELLQPCSKAPGSGEWKTPEPHTFFEQVDFFKSAFLEGELKKAVPVCHAERSFETDTQTKAFLLLNALAYVEKNPAYLYGYWREGEGILGCTPEMLLEKEQQHYRTVALAGTYPLDKEDAHLLMDKKERVEHSYVIEGIEASLSPFGAVEKSQAAVMKLPTLKHLRTDITFKPESDVSFETLFTKMHPTPALGVFPKRCESYLRVLSLGNRKRFGSPFAASWQEGQRALVAIRNLQWTENKLQIFAGCGLLPESDPLNEWNEIQLKMQSVRNIYQV